MSDVKKPFFSEPATPREGDLASWLLKFYDAWLREFSAVSGNVDILILGSDIVGKLVETKEIAERAKDQIGHIIYLGNEK